MIIHVFQPNDFVIELRMNPKAIGKDCLEEVCARLKIIEIHFFGLQYWHRNQFYWLCLRGRIDKQIATIGLNRNYRLYLRVKFFVPPHQIQQNSTRHQFYLNVLNHFERFELVDIGQKQRIKLIALIAQIDFGDFDPDSIDLKLIYSKWISMLFGSGKNSSENNFDKILKRNSAKRLSIDIGKHSKLMRKILSMAREILEYDDHLRSVCLCHKQLNGYSSMQAKNIFLRETFEIKNLGVEHYRIRMFNNKKGLIGIGSKELSIIDQNSKMKLIGFDKIKEMKYNWRGSFFNQNFEITISFQEENVLMAKTFRLNHQRQATDFYRLLMERRLFFSFPDVESIMTGSRFYSFFNSLVDSIQSTSSTTNAKITPRNLRRLQFDVDRTLRQSYDDNCRFTYHLNQCVNAKISANTLDRYAMTLDDQSSDSSIKTNKDNGDLKSSLCRICCDKLISIVFVPCGHILCNDCCIGIRNETCPFCKGEIELKQKIFL